MMAEVLNPTISLADIVGLAGVTLLTVSLALNLFVVRFFPKWVRWTVVGLALAIVFAPFERLPGIFYIRALTGDMSITTTLLLALFAYMQLNDKTPVKARPLGILCALILAAGCFLYPLELGLSMYTPYPLGYGSNLLFAALFLLALAAWITNNELVVLCLLAASTAYLLGLLESRNLWDYLIDPVCVLFSIVFLLIQLIRKALSSLNPQDVPALRVGCEAQEAKQS